MRRTLREQVPAQTVVRTYTSKDFHDDRGSKAPPECVASKYVHTCLVRSHCVNEKLLVPAGVQKSAFPWEEDAPYEK